MSVIRSKLKEVMENHDPNAERDWTIEESIDHQEDGNDKKTDNNGNL